jgi:plastocyanin
MRLSARLKMVCVGLLLCCLAGTPFCYSQGVTVSGTVVPEGTSAGPSTTSTVVWLAPLGAAASAPVAPMHAVLAQKNKEFEPHLLVVTRGSTIEFPNRDPWFHNVFSLFDGKRFDLGLYEAGTSRTVHFDREGISFIFCNIHSEMSAVIVVLGSPYFTMTNKQGQFSIPSVPPGRYLLHVWNENALPATLQDLSREVQVGDSAKYLDPIRIPLTRSASMPHKNKYGKDYEPPSPNNPVYVQP